MKHRSTYIYTAVFCVRRFLFVMWLFAFGNDGRERNIYILLVIQSVYVAYLANYRPHTEKMYNWLEMINETGVTMLAYCMFSINPDGMLDSNEQWMAGNVVVGLLATIVIVNAIFVLCYNGIGAKAKYAKWKAARNKKLAYLKPERVDVEERYYENVLYARNMFA